MTSAIATWEQCQRRVMPLIEAGLNLQQNKQAYRDAIGPGYGVYWERVKNLRANTIARRKPIEKKRDKQKKNTILMLSAKNRNRVHAVAARSRASSSHEATATVTVATADLADIYARLAQLEAENASHRRLLVECMSNHQIYNSNFKSMTDTLNAHDALFIRQEQPCMQVRLDQHDGWYVV